MLAQKKVSGLVVENDPFFDSRRLHLIQLTAQRSIPAIYHIREFPLAGGLMSYGTNLVDAYNQMGVLAGRIPQGRQHHGPSRQPPNEVRVGSQSRHRKNIGTHNPDDCSGNRR